MVGITEATAAISGIKAAIDIAKGVQALKASTEIRQATSEMLDALLTAKIAAVDAHEAESALIQQVRELEAEIASMKSWDGEKERYELQRFYPGSFAYSLKPELAAGEPPHHLCQHCYESGQKSRLQATDAVRARYRVHRCHTCNDEIVLGGRDMGEIEAPPQTRPVPRVVMGRQRNDGM